MGGKGSGIKKGYIRKGSMVWRLLQMKMGDSFFVTQEQRSFTGYFPRANRIKPDMCWTTQYYWAVPFNRLDKPELLTKVTKVTRVA